MNLFRLQVAIAVLNVALMAVVWSGESSLVWTKASTALCAGFCIGMAVSSGMRWYFEERD